MHNHNGCFRRGDGLGHGRILLQTPHVVDENGAEFDCAGGDTCLVRIDRERHLAVAERSEHMLDARKLLCF